MYITRSGCTDQKLSKLSVINLKLHSRILTLGRLDGTEDEVSSPNLAKKKKKKKRRRRRRNGQQVVKMATQCVAPKVPDVAVNVLIEKRFLHCPPLQELVEVLQKGLISNFVEVTVEIVECPDLTEEPFTLACKGLGGKPRLVEVGGVPYLLPHVKREKLYDLKHIGLFVDLDSAFIIGAGAGPWPYAGTNCEMMANLLVHNQIVNNHSRIAKVNQQNQACILERLPDTETRSALLANLFCCEGKPGKVLKVHCKKRIGSDDFIASIRKTLMNHYKDQAVGLGGTFLLKEGKALQHVMPDFDPKGILDEEALNNWLHFFDQSAPLIAVGTLVSADPGLDLRVQHFHSFSHHGEGGHYHNDTQPDIVEYLGYFAVAESVHRVDRPVETHTMGRD